jgi:hypothetical protein
LDLVLIVLLFPYLGALQRLLQILDEDHVFELNVEVCVELVESRDEKVLDVVDEYL